MYKAVESIVAGQGWSDSTVRGLLFTFIERHDLLPALADYLADLADEDEDLADEDEEDAG